MLARVGVLTDAEFWPDTVLMVLVANLLSFGMTIFLAGVLATA